MPVDLQKGIIHEHFGGFSDCNFAAFGIILVEF